MTRTDWLLSEGEDADLLQVAESAFREGWPKLVGVAVSGGSDSMALLHLFARVAAHHGGIVRAVTVNHRLRPEAADEAKFVARACKALGAGHDTLVWDHREIVGNLQDQARRARYRLISEWAQAHRISHVVVGHTADDQAETFLMGLARGAGIDGLSGMRKGWEAGGVNWLRPYLNTSREELRAYLRRNGIAWVEDPSNADDRFTRVKARKVMKALRPLGITVDRLSAVTRNLAIAQDSLRVAASEGAKQIARTSAGEIVIDRAALLALSQETARRILVGALRWVASSDYAPRAQAISRLEDAIGRGKSSTLAGARIVVVGADIRITREPKAVADLETGTDMLWDGRWRLSGPHERGLTVRALGSDGLRLCEAWRSTGQSRAVLVVTPAIWRGETLVAAPLAGRENGWKAEIVAGFHSFLLSH